MLRKLVFVGMILVLMVSFSVVLADQDGKTCWCNVDKDGCWVTNEEGGKDYIMFWSEASRKFFMGDKTAPYANVVDRAEGATLRMMCGVAPKSVVGAAEEKPYCTYKRDSNNNYAVVTDEQGNPVITKCFSESELQKEFDRIISDLGPNYVCEWDKDEHDISCWDPTQFVK